MTDPGKPINLDGIEKMDVSEFRKLVANPPLPLVVMRYGKPKFLVLDLSGVAKALGEQPS